MVWIKDSFPLCQASHMRLKDQRAADRQISRVKMQTGRPKVDRNEDRCTGRRTGLWLLSAGSVWPTFFFNPLYSFSLPCSLPHPQWPLSYPEGTNECNKSSEQFPSDTNADSYLSISLCLSELSRLLQLWLANHAVYLSSPLWQSYNPVFFFLKWRLY